MHRFRALLTFGTRPEAIKMAPVVHECRRRPEEIETVVCLTGQHREMLAQVTDYFGIEADVDLAVMRPNQSLVELTSRCLTGLDEVLVRYQPDCVVAQGDTTTVMAAALAAFYHRIPFVHVEAGLRTFDMQAPWPEEMNRRVAGLMTALHCAPTRRAAENLLAERVPAETVHVTGNTVIDALLWAVDRERGCEAVWRQKYAALGDRRMVLITGHRRENFGSGMESICNAIATLAERFAGQQPLWRRPGGRADREPCAPAYRGTARFHTESRIAPPIGHHPRAWARRFDHTTECGCLRST